MKRVRFDRSDILPIALLGITQFGILVVLLNHGLKHIPAAQAALIFSLFPLLTMIIAAALRLERMTVPKTVGVVLTIVGVAISLGVTSTHSIRDLTTWIGAGAILLSAFCGAGCSVLYRPYLTKYPAVPVSAFAMIASVAVLAVFSWGEGFFGAPLRITGVGWGAIIFIGVSSGLGYFLWLWALGHTTPTKVTVFLGLSPPTAALLGAFLLGEPLTITLLAGVITVVAGLWIAHRPSLPFMPPLRR